MKQVIKMNPAKLNKRIAFEAYDPNAKDEDGYPLKEEDAWTQVKLAWASIKTLKGREFIEAQAVQAENTVRFIVRHAKDVNTKMRIIYNQRKFNIESIINDDEKNKTLTIIAKEVI